MIGVDWGTTNFRAWRLDGAGRIVDRHASAMGLLRVPPGQFAAILRQEVQSWLAQGETTLVLSGMVGSRGGWVETGYVSCPAWVRDLARGLVEVPFDGARVWITPGVECTTPGGVPEVMRGEETAIAGAMGLIRGTGLVCLPGTHSKWVKVADEAIQAFTTHMTGEVFAALRYHTILSQFADDETSTDMEAFTRGVEHSAHGGGLLHHLFRARTLPLKGLLPRESTASFLSGLLIDHEVRAMLPPAGTVLLLGTTALCSLYAAAIQQCGGTSMTGDPDCAGHGLFLLAGESTRNGGYA